MSSNLLNQKTLEKYDTDLVSSAPKTPPISSMRKWNTEPALKLAENIPVVKSASDYDIGVEKQSDVVRMNPLRKWREMHLATSADLSLQEEDEEEDVSSNENISGVSTPQPDTDAESEAGTDREELALQPGPSTRKEAPKKGFLGFFKSLTPESKIPKLGQKLGLETLLVSKIPKPITKLIKPDSQSSGTKVPLLSKLYNLSKREPVLPKIDFANLSLFDNPEPNEFTEDLEGQKEIQRFLKKYTVPYS